ncbi:FTR1 family protein [Cellvibrio sp. pealriver]|uniref:FTR1 family protein n=1 Tax=Cellvibrio sp. pealriver TaxID=1622269 RepID=UPI00066FFE70|nr:FTR1 family protein [Cellvibrio sp. pealriver]
MLDAVLLILREVLEAALILSLLLALGNKLKFHYRWSFFALAIGVLGSWLLAHFAYDIADAMEGMGQELLNAALYAAVILSLIALALLILPLLFGCSAKSSASRGVADNRTGLFHSLFIIIVSLSLMREGSEIWIYLSAFTHNPNAMSSALIGAAIGTGIGMSLGAIIYYVFAFMREKYFLPVFLVVITLLAGGLSMQVAKQLMQIGLLDSGTPLWDSSFLVDEHSWLGELLYALVGYDSRPAPVQGIFYLFTVAPILLASLWRLIRSRVNTHA